MNDLAQRFGQNPILSPRDLRPSVEGMDATCVLNPGVVRFDDRTWLLVGWRSARHRLRAGSLFPSLILRAALKCSIRFGRCADA